jgi:hypothetical protein
MGADHVDAMHDVYYRHGFTAHTPCRATLCAKTDRVAKL